GGDRVPDATGRRIGGADGLLGATRPARRHTRSARGGVRRLRRVHPVSMPCRLVPMRILVVDVGGSHVKVLATGKRTPLKVPSGSTLTPAAMVRQVQAVTKSWRYDRVSVGYPGAVLHGKPVAEPT